MNSIFIGKSLDGFIADKEGGLDWLEMIPNTEQSDMGYVGFMKRIDALVMGRITFETVCGFDCPWPYDKPVFVLSNSLEEIPSEYAEKAMIVNGSLTDVLSEIQSKGYKKLYIDGGKTIQQFLREDLIDEMIVSTLPILLGDGIPLFGSLDTPLEFSHVSSSLHLGEIVQNHYKRKRN